VRLLDIDSEDPASLGSVPFASYDAFLNVCNPVSFRFAKAAGTPTAYLDFLLWMHSGPSAEHFDADLYLAENYPGTLEWIQERGSEIPNLVVIPPLIRRAVERRPVLRRLADVGDADRGPAAPARPAGAGVDVLPLPPAAVTGGGLLDALGVRRHEPVDECDERGRVGHLARRRPG